MRAGARAGERPARWWQSQESVNPECTPLPSAAQARGGMRLPDTFRTCYRATSIRSFDLRDYLFRGSFPEANDVCCHNRIGNQLVKGAQQAHRERTGEFIPIRMFYNSHISGNDFTPLVRANSWADSMGL
jgi:hypothetical protein